MTTQWQNAFDLGACTVSVRPTDFSGGFDAPLWSGVLAKGDSHGPFSGSAGENLAVSVDDEGVVTLENDTFGNIIYALDVTPSYTVDGVTIQAAAISAELADTSGFASNLAASSPVAVSYTQGTAPAVTPDVASLTGAGATGWRCTNGSGTE